MSFNDSEVEQVSLQHFGADNKATGKNDETREKELRYPKVRSLQLLQPEMETGFSRIDQRPH